MNKYLLHGKFTVNEGNDEQLIAILLEASKLVSTASGCLLYAVSKDPTQMNNVWVTEVWATKEDHDNSLNIAGVKELISKAIPLLNERPQKGQELEVVGGI